MRKTDGSIRSIQIDIPLEAHEFMKRHLESCKISHPSMTLAGIIREALAAYYHVSPELFSVKESGARKKGAAK